MSLNRRGSLTAECDTHQACQRGQFRIHGQDIDLININLKGQEFPFTLPQAPADFDHMLVRLHDRVTQMGVK